MKGEVTLKILESIKDFAVDTADLFNALLSAGYGASYGKIDRELSKIQRKRQYKEFIQEQRKHLKEKYYKMIYALKRDGLIQKRWKSKKRFWELTKKGEVKLTVLTGENSIRLPEISYLKKNANRVIVVIFDVPETQKRKRNWLREVLKNLDFQMVQKSVWVGKTKIPQDFLDDLFKLKLVDFVEIFEISRTGSLKHLI